MRYINDADDKEKLKYGILAGTVATAAVGALMIALGKRKKNRKYGFESYFLCF